MADGSKTVPVPLWNRSGIIAPEPTASARQNWSGTMEPRSADPAMVALHRSGVELREVERRDGTVECWKEPELADWEEPKRDPRERRPRAPRVTNERASAKRRDASTHPRADQKVGRAHRDEVCQFKDYCT